MHGLMGRWVDGWVGEWVNQKVDRQMDEEINAHQKKTFIYKCALRLYFSIYPVEGTFVQIIGLDQSFLAVKSVLQEGIPLANTGPGLQRVDSFGK